MIVLLLLLLVCATHLAAASDCTVSPEDQQKALRNVFSAWGGPTWRRKEGWLDTSIECEDSGLQLPAHCCWHGIKCYISRTCSEGERPEYDRCGCEPGLVWEISLESNNLTGEFSSLDHNAFACHLSGIRLSNNKLRGQIGPDFPVYKKLYVVDLNSNSLEGPLPPGIGRISSLNILSLSSNLLEGPVPSDLCGNYTNLWSLALDDNNFSGSLDISRCTGLGYFLGKGNKFDQVWDNSGIAALPEIRGVFLEENGLRGALPDDMFISFLPRLEQLGLRNNKHSGTLPAMSLFSLKFVDLTGNRFAGPVPDSWAIMARPGLEVALHTNYLSCCGTGPLSPEQLMEADDTLRIDDVYNGVDYSAPLLPPSLELSDELQTVFVRPRQSFKANGMRCPKLKLAGQEEGPASDLGWSLDPSYYMFVKCECEKGLQLVNLTKPGRLPYLECQPLIDGNDSKPWEEDYPWAIVIIVVLGCVLLITLLLGFYLYKGTEVVQRLNNLKKRMHGLPSSGPFTAVVTDIQGWTALCAEHPELSSKVLSIHNSILRKARWNNFGSTHETEGDSYTMVFYEAKDAVAFCLQAQQMLSMQPWPSLREANSEEQSTHLMSSFENPVSELVRKKSCSNNSFAILNPLSISRRMKHHSTTSASSTCLDVRVRMGLASGFLVPGESLHGHPTIDLAKEVSDTAAGGQILMEGSTFSAIKDVLGELGTVDAQGMHLDRLRMRRVFHWPAFFLCRCIAPAAAANSEDAIVLDMGTYTNPGSDQGQKQAWSPPWSPCKRRSSKHLFPTSRLSFMGTAYKPSDPDELHLYQALPSSSAECAKKWGSKLRLKSEKSLKDSLSKGYFDAPGTLAAPLGISKSPADESLPLVTTVFASVEQARVLSSKDMRQVERGLLACASKCLDQVQGDGYLCRVFGNLKLMLCFSKPEAALAWSCAMQECMMAQPWPRAALKEPFKEKRDQHGNLIFRGPRLRIGISQGRPKSIQPDHLGRADYHGDCVNSAARFMEGAAQGGQIVCEQDVAMRAAEAWAATQPSAQPEQAIGTPLHTVQSNWSPFQSLSSSYLQVQQQKQQKQQQQLLLQCKPQCKPQDGQSQDSAQRNSPQSVVLPIPEEDDKQGASPNSDPIPRSESLYYALRPPLPVHTSAPQPGQKDRSSPKQQCLGNVHVFWMGLFRFKGLPNEKSMVHVLQDKLASRAAGYAPKSMNPGAATLVSQLQPKGPSLSTYLVPLPVVECPPNLPEPKRTATLVRFELEGCQRGSDSILNKLSASSLKKKLSAHSQ